MKTIGRDFGDVARKVYATASGVLPNGKPVAVNSDGTVSVVASTGSAVSVGSAVVFDSGNTRYIGSTFDSNSNKVIIAYEDRSNSSYGTVVVGTVSGVSISFGTAVVFESASTRWISATFDSNSNKVVIAYSDQGSGGAAGTAIVGTVSGTGISFGSPAVFESSNVVQTGTACTFDSNANKVVIAYSTPSGVNLGRAVVATVSGTNISFGSVATFQSAYVEYVSIAFDSNVNKVVVVYRNNSNSGYGTSAVGTISGTNISFGTPVIFYSQNTQSNGTTYDPIAEKIVICFKNQYFVQGWAFVGTISGTSISFGANAVFNSTVVYDVSVNFDSRLNKVVVSYMNNGGVSLSVGTISGTTISFDTAVSVTSTNGEKFTATFDSNSNRVVNCLSASSNGPAIVVKPGNLVVNLTAENYIGMSSGGVDFNIGPEAFGSEVAFESAATYFTASAYDSNANKTVVVYRDSGNSNYGTAVVGTVNPSNNSISFGTPVVFEAANTSEIGIGFDSNANKFVIAYNDAGNSGYGTAIVGTVSGTNISFGTAVVFQSTATYFSKVVFDSNSNKIVLAYKQDGTGEKGTSRVGTISGTDISFGTAVVFVDEKAMFLDATFDSNSNKVVVGFVTANSSDSGAATVGTVSGTNISFGSKVVFNSGATNTVRCAFDSTNNKVVFAYRNAGSSNVGTAIVGTVSGTSISFGTASVFQASQTTLTAVVYDPEAKKVIITYKDQATGSNGTLIPGIVSGTSISFETKAVFNVGSTEDASASYDSGSNKVVINYRDETNSNYGTSIVYQPAFDKTVRGQVASGGAVLVNTKGAININQNALTAGQSYFVQTDGTITTTAGTPSVFAGTAVSATKLIVKG